MKELSFLLILLPILYVVEVLPFNLAFEITKWGFMAMIAIGYLIVWYFIITMHRKEGTDARNNVQRHNPNDRCL
uniref:Uncharacterized protein n=1 Tax=viral metagenome TaxID=1070528 RepID=A0A6H2A605_9ZZZZ